MSETILKERLVDLVYRLRNELYGLRRRIDALSDETIPGARIFTEQIEVRPPGEGYFGFYPSGTADPPEFFQASVDDSVFWDQYHAFHWTIDTNDPVEFTQPLIAPNIGYSVVTKTAGYTEAATNGELVIKADLAAGFTIVLSTAVGNRAKIHVKKMQAAGSIVLDGAGSETIDGALTATLAAQYESITLVSDNTNWLVVR
jgi:hypothetical protein